MNLSLTGATGFVGGYVLREALARGHTVTALARTVPDITHPNLTWIQGSLGTRDTELCDGADTVIHIAGLIKARTRAAFMAVNRDATAALASAAGESHILYLSSLAARELQLSSYAASKRDGEDVIPTTSGIIRAPAVFGPGDEATRPYFALMARGQLPVPGGKDWRSRRLSFVFIEDLARHILDRAEEQDSGTTTPATLASAKWSDFRNLAQDAADRPIALRPIPTAALLPVAAATSLTSRLAGLGHLTLEKLREFQHPDWSVEEELADATPMVDALRQTFESYR